MAGARFRMMRAPGQGGWSGVIGESVSEREVAGHGAVW